MEMYYLSHSKLVTDYYSIDIYFTTHENPWCIGILTYFLQLNTADILYPNICGFI